MNTASIIIWGALELISITLFVSAVCMGWLILSGIVS